MKNSKNSEERDFDYGKVAEDYDKYRKPFPDTFFEQLKLKELIGPKKVVLDLGAGTGMIARKIAQLEPECRITALDCSQGMLDTAAKHDKKLGITNITYHCSPAEKTGMPPASVDLIIAARCWHWFDQAKTIQEIKRIAKPNATLVITHFDPALEENNALDVTTKLIKQYDSTWELPIKKKLDREYEYINQLMNENFANIELQVFIKREFVSQSEWVNFFNTTSGVGGNSNLSKEQVDSLNKDHAQILETKFGDKPLDVKYVLSMMFFEVPKVKPKEEEQPSLSESLVKVPT
ncbi:MAG: hypothetical protein Tsb005_14240 [Gammaproteobacteria bacterium]